MKDGMISHTNAPVQSRPGGPDAHVMARHFRTGVHLLLVLALITTVVCLLFGQQAASPFAIPFPVLCAVLAFTNDLEFRSRALNLRKRGETAISRKKLEVNIETDGNVTRIRKQ